jgi:hypothetical protein
MKFEDVISVTAKVKKIVKNPGGRNQQEVDVLSEDVGN